MRARRLLLVAASVAVAALVAFAWIGPFVAQDRCLDASGAWRDGRCIHR